MTPEQQRIAIAEACGEDNDSIYRDLIPDYLNDLNAMQQVQEVLKGGMRSTYDAELTLICSRDYNFIWESTASQRAEAFLRTIGKWKEAK